MSKRDEHLRAMLTAAGAQVTSDNPWSMTEQALMPILQLERRNTQELARAYELLVTVVLDGDRAANHLFHWQLDDAFWTPAAASAAIGFYDLPHDPDTGLLDPAELFGAIDRAMTAPTPSGEAGTLREAVRRDAPRALAGPCLTQMTHFDAEMYERHPTTDLTVWAANTPKSRHGRDITRWRHIQYLVLGNAAKGKATVGF